MLSRSLREHLQARPFRPFVIQMNDGRRFRVPHPEFAAISPNGAEFVAFNRDGGGALFLSTLLIASIEPLRSKARRS